MQLDALEPRHVRTDETAGGVIRFFEGTGNPNGKHGMSVFLRAHIFLSCFLKEIGKLQLKGWRSKCVVA